MTSTAPPCASSTTTTTTSNLEHRAFNRQRPDYELIKSIADYFADFPANCHHPKEDVLYGKLCERNPEAARAMGDLEEEHDSVAVRLDAFNRAIDNVLLEVEVPHEAFCAAARQFIDDERKHMLMEERYTKGPWCYFFPVALDALEDEDWSDIEARLRHTTDPLFGAIVKDRFRTLRQELMEWGGLAV